MLDALSEPKVSKDILAFYDKIDKQKISLSDTSGLVNFAKGMELADEEFLKFISNTENADKSLAAYKKQLASSTDGLSNFTAGFKSLAANLGIMLAITVAVKALSAAFDYLNVTFKEQQEIVDDLTTKVSELQAEYEKLKEDPSTSGAKLNYLKREIESQQQLLDIEKKKLALQDMRENMPKTDADPVTRSVSNGSSSYGINSLPISQTEAYSTDIEKELNTLYQIREKYQDAVENRPELTGYIKDLENQESSQLKSLEDWQKTLREKQVELLDTQARFQGYIDDGFLTGNDAQIAQAKIDKLQKELDNLDPLILAVDLELGDANYLQAYNKMLDEIQKKRSHMRSTDFAQIDGGQLRKIIKVSDLDNILNKNKELNQSLIDGKISSEEYFNSISKLISDSGLDVALTKINDWSTQKTDYLEETVSALATQVSDGMLESTGKFLRDESSVRDYADDIEAASKAEMKMLKSLYKLEDAEDGHVDILDDMSEETKDAAESYNRLADQLNELSEIDGMLDVNTQYADLVADYNNWTEEMLNTDALKNYVSDMATAIADFAQQNKDTIGQVASELSTATGVAIDEQMLLSDNASNYLAGVVGNNLSAVQGMVNYSSNQIGNTITNSSQAMGKVLNALGNMIQNFEYSITATPFIQGNKSGKLIDVDEEGRYSIGLLPNFGFKFKGTGGSAVTQFTDALFSASNFYTNQGEQIAEKIRSGKSYGQKDNKTGGSGSQSKSPSGSGSKDSKGSGGSGSSSSKDPYVADIDKYKDLTDAVDEVETKIKHLNQVYDHTDSISGQIALKDELIGLYKEEQDALTALNSARDKEIAKNVQDLRAVGFKIEYDPKSDNLKIKNREYLNKIAQDDIQKTEKLIKATEELNDANKESAEKWRELTFSIADVGKEITELRINQYEEYVSDKEHLLDLLGNRKNTIGMDLSVYDDLMKGTLRTWQYLVKDGYEKNKEQIQDLEKTWMDYYDARIKREQEILEKQLDDHDRALDAVLDFIDDQLDGLDDQIDALKKINEERKEALELQKAQIALDKARNQKTRKVLRKGKGYIYEADEDAIREAEENIAEKQYEASVKQLEKQKENLEELKKVWSEIPDLFEKYQNELLASQILGANWEQKILDGREDAYEDFKDAYFDLQEDIQDKADELENHMNQSYINMVEIFRKMADLYGNMNNISSASSGKSWYVNKDGKAPSQAQVWDIIYTKGGTYQITGKDENGKFTSKKLDDKSTDIKDGMWGTLVSDSNAQLGKAIGSNTLSNQNIVDTANKQIDTMFENITGMDVVSNYLANNTFFTQEEINTLAKQMGITDLNTGAVNLNVDATDANTDSQNENTDSLNNATDAIDNLSVAVRNMAVAQAEADAYNTANNMKEGVSNEKWLKYWDDVLNFSDRTGLLTQEEVNNALAQRNRYQELVNQEKAIQDMVNGVTSSTLKVDLSDEDKKIIKELQKAYNTAKAAGNEEGMELAHQLAEAVRNGFDISPSITTKPDYKLSDTTYTGGASASTGNKSNLQKDYEWQLSKAKEFGASKDYISRLENAIARETYGSGSKIDTYTDEYGRTSTIINAADKSELNMSAEDLKNRYDAGWRPVNDGMDKLGGNLKETNDTLSDNSDAMYDSSDKIDGSADKIVDSSNNVVGKLDSLENAISNANFGGGYSSGGTSSGGSSGSNRKGGSSDPTKGMSAEDKARYNNLKTTAAIAERNGNTAIKNAAKSQMADIKDKYTKKKAKGGRNLVEDIYNVDEYGKKELIIQPTTGRYVHLSQGSTVIPADATKNLWDFGENPTQYMGSMIKSLNYKLNTGGETINHYNIDKLELPNVVDGKEFWENMTQNLPNEAAQWAHTSTRYRV